SSGTNSAEELTAAQVRTLLNVADGATAGITTAPSNIVATWSIGGNSGSGYQFTGPGQDGSEGNPDIYLVRGQKYRFVNTTGTGHPFEFRNEANNADYTDGITGSQSGTQEFNVQHDAPAALKYRCTIHTGSMLGNIYIVGQHLANGVNNRVLTATSAYGMNGEANLTWDGNSLDLTAGTGNQFPIQIRNDFTPNSQRADYASLLNATSNNTLRLGSINSNGGATIQVTRGNDSAVKHDLILQPDGGNIGINVSPESGYLLHIKDGSADAKVKIESESGNDARLV
ncbi:MAG: hypothetical protein VXY93_13760, partial [Pseudomonadota bacterium]|nr:hypothetical protein [Pseudomonadota bacterium]